MKIEEVLHMLGGGGENSYANNSRLQAKAILKTHPLVEEAISETCSSLLIDYFVAADLGCSSSPNAFLVISQIIDAINKHCNQHNHNCSEIQYFLNDLPSNDFNYIFQNLMLYEKKAYDNKIAEQFVPLYAAGLPGSFYGRLFPSKSVHFFHSSYSLMWLSQVPQGLDGTNNVVNKGNIYITDATSSIMSHLYLCQFKKDFSEFLRSRSKELIFGGKMVLSFLGKRKSPAIGEIFHLWRLLSEALNEMMSEGLVEEDKLNAFYLPFYAPLMDEVKTTIESEGSFHVENGQTFDSNWDPFDDADDNAVIDSKLSGENVAKYIRAILEPLLGCHFGGVIMDDLFSRYAKKLACHFLKGKAKYVVFMLVLKLKE